MSLHISLDLWNTMVKQTRLFKTKINIKKLCKPLHKNLVIAHVDPMAYFTNNTDIKKYAIIVRSLAKHLKSSYWFPSLNHNVYPNVKSVIFNSLYFDKFE